MLAQIYILNSHKRIKKINSNIDKDKNIEKQKKNPKSNKIFKLNKKKQIIQINMFTKTMEYVI